MKTIYILLLVLASCIMCNGQEKSILKDDTLFYSGEKYYNGKVILFGRASGEKEFSFIWLGSGSGLNITKAPAGYSMMEVQVIKLRKQVWLSVQKNFIEVDMFVGKDLKVHNWRNDIERHKLIPEKYWALSDYSTFTIHLQGAVDAKELINKDL